MKEQVSQKQRNLYQNEVDEQIKEVDSKDKVKQNKRERISYF